MRTNAKWTHDSESNPEAHEATEVGLHVSAMTVTAALDKEAVGGLWETVWDGESVAIMWTSPIHGRAIDRWATDSNIATRDLRSLTERVRNADGARNALELSQLVGPLIMFLNPITKEKERANPVWDKTVPLDSDGCRNDPREEAERAKRGTEPSDPRLAAPRGGWNP